MLAERSLLFSEVAELASREKDLIVALTERYNKIHQHYSLLKWISEQLSSITTERANTRSTLDGRKCITIFHTKKLMHVYSGAYYRNNCQFKY